MANIVIKDLEMNEELDHKAMQKLTGGWGMISQSSSMGSWWGPGGFGSFQQSSSFSAWGGGWGPGPFGGFPGPGWGFPWGWPV